MNYISIKLKKDLKRKKILKYMMTWMSPKDIMLSERNQSQKGKDCMIPFTVCGLSKIARFIKSKSTLVVARGWGANECY